MSVILYKVKDNAVIPCEDNPLDPESIYIIVAKTQIRPKIWVWSGPNSSIKDRYFAGVSATTIKSQEKLYGSSIEVVEGGSEPEQFPKMDTVQIMKASEIEIPRIERPDIAEDTIASSVEVNAMAPEIVPEQRPVEYVVEGVEEPVNIEEKPSEGVVVEEVAATTPTPGRKKPLKKAAAKVDFVFNEKLKSLLRELSLGLESLKAKVEAFLGEL